MNNPSRNPSALIYRRVSTGHQDASLEAQEHGNDLYCKNLGIAVVSDHADEDVSGSIPFAERPHGRALLNRLKHGDITDVVTSKQDRLGRDTFDAIQTIRHLWRLGITVHFTGEGGALPHTSQNELLFEIKASVAQYERNLIRERTAFSLRRKAAQGLLTGTIPFGFDGEYTFADGHVHVCGRALFWGRATGHGSKGRKNDPPEPEAAALVQFHGNLVSKRLVPNPAEQATVRRLEQWREQRVQFKEMARRLNAEGVPTKRGGPWQTSTVNNLLHSRVTAQLLQASALDNAA